MEHRKDQSITYVNSRTNMPSRNKILAMCLQDRLYFNLFIHVTGISRKCMIYLYYCGVIYRNYPIIAYGDVKGSWRDLHFRSNLRIVRPIYFVFFYYYYNLHHYLLFVFVCFYVNDVFFSISIRRHYKLHLRQLYHITIRPRLSPLADVQRVIGHLLRCDERR